MRKTKTQGAKLTKATKTGRSTTTKATLVKGTKKPRFTQPTLKSIMPKLKIPKS